MTHYPSDSDRPVYFDDLLCVNYELYMCMYVHICVCVCVYVCIYIYIYMYIFIYLFISVQSN